jgi:hypothetical protein
MPGLDLHATSPAFDAAPADNRTNAAQVLARPVVENISDVRHRSFAPYYNPRLDPKHYMEGPLSSNPSTRLRQMLARPGIVVGFACFLSQTSIFPDSGTLGCTRYL